mgnify:CR=1 FL=1
MSKVHVHHHNATAEGVAIAVVVAIALFSVVLAAPGALLVFAIDRTVGLSLDCAQLWTFAAVASAAIIGGLAADARCVGTGMSRFLALAFAVGAFLVVARLGFQAVWPAELWNAFVGHR